MHAYEKQAIKQWALEDRPREKLAANGVASLSNAELLAILLRSGDRDQSAVTLARRVLATVENNLQELGRKSLTELIRHKGIGPVKAITLLAALELGRRRDRHPLAERKKISGSRDVFQHFHPLLSDLIHEEFWILLLNRSNRMVESIRISQGGISGTVIDVRLILKHALDRLSSSVILCHNHPSGNLKPSDADTQITRKIGQACETMDIQLLDHLILADNSYFSYADEGLI